MFLTDIFAMYRDVRHQPAEQFSQALNSLTSGGQTFSQYGQCGKRNAHGVNGRINNPALLYEEGDTEFGEYPWQVRRQVTSDDKILLCVLIGAGGHPEEGAV